MRGENRQQSYVYDTENGSDYRLAEDSSRFTPLHIDNTQPQNSPVPNQQYLLHPSPDTGNGTPLNQGISSFTAMSRYEGFILRSQSKNMFEELNNPIYAAFPFWNLLKSPTRPTKQNSFIISAIDEETWVLFAMEITSSERTRFLSFHLMNLLWCFFAICIFAILVGRERMLSKFFDVLILSALVGFLFVVNQKFYAFYNQDIDGIVDRYQHGFNRKGIQVQFDDGCLVFTSIQPVSVPKIA